MLNSDVDLMRSLPLFGRFDSEQLKLIAFSARQETCPEGPVLFREGESADCGYLITDGSVLMTEAADGEDVERAIYGRGALIGELALLTPTDRPATAVTRSECTFLVITRDLLRRVLEEYPDMAVELQDYLRERLARFSHDLATAKVLEPVPGVLN